MICVERVDAALTGQAVPAGEHGALRQEIAPVWEMVEAAIRQGEAYAPSVYVLLAVAALIGAVGLLTNSQILIVGAMVVGPEYNAIIGVFISVTTIPAAASAGVSIASSSWGEAWGSLLQLLLNVALLVIVGAAGLHAQRAIWPSCRLRRRLPELPAARPVHHLQVRADSQPDPSRPAAACRPRGLAADPGLREDYRAHRPNVERVIAQVATFRGRRLRLHYRGVTRNHAWPKRRTAALNLRNLAARGLTRRDGTWILAT